MINTGKLATNQYLLSIRDKLCPDFFILTLVFCPDFFIFGTKNPHNSTSANQLISTSSHHLRPHPLPIKSNRHLHDVGATLLAQRSFIVAVFDLFKRRIQGLVFGFVVEMSILAKERNAEKAIFRSPVSKQIKT